MVEVGSPTGASDPGPVMPISFLSGSLFERDSQLLVCPANTRGVAGAGLALEFKQRFPSQVDYYRKVCRSGGLKPGQLLVNPETMEDDPVIMFAATKDDWRAPSKRQWIIDCLEGINIFLIDHQDFNLVSIPALGCGLGKLSWQNLRPRFESILSSCVNINSELHVQVFEPHKLS